MVHSLKTITFLVLFIFSLMAINAQSTQDGAWSLVKENGKTRVYTRSNKDSKIKEVRIRTQMNVDFEHFIKVLSDVPKYNKWVYKGRNAKLLDQINDNEMYYFMESDFPFPLSDRDMVIHSRQWRDPVSKTYNSKSVAVPHYLPKDKKMVRLPMLEAYWKISPRPNGGIEIDYQALADPGGNLPAWLINLAITQGPIKTMEQLEALALEVAPASSAVGDDK